MKRFETFENFTRGHGSQYMRAFAAVKISLDLESPSARQREYEAELQKIYRDSEYSMIHGWAEVGFIAVQTAKQELDYAIFLSPGVYTSFNTAFAIENELQKMYNVVAGMIDMKKVEVRHFCGNSSNHENEWVKDRMKECIDELLSSANVTDEKIAQELHTIRGKIAGRKFGF